MRRLIASFGKNFGPILGALLFIASLFLVVRIGGLNGVFLILLLLVALFIRPLDQYFYRGPGEGQSLLGRLLGEKGEEEGRAEETPKEG